MLIYEDQTVYFTFNSGYYGNIRASAYGFCGGWCENLFKTGVEASGLSRAANVDSAYRHMELCRPGEDHRPYPGGYTSVCCVQHIHVDKLRP